MEWHEEHKELTTTQLGSHAKRWEVQQNSILRIISIMFIIEN